MENQSQNPAGGISLVSVLESFENFVGNVSQAVQEALPEDESKVLAATTATVVYDQFVKVNSFIREQHERLAPLHKDKIQKFLQVQTGHTMAIRGMETAASVLKIKNFGKKLLRWLVKFFQEIKKVVSELLHLIFEALGIKFPSWLDKLLLILDQCWAAFVALLSDLVGYEGVSFQREASGMEVDYLNELAAFERLRQVKDTGNSSADEL